MPENTTPSTSGSGNKMWYIIGAIVVLLLVGWVISRGIGGAAILATGGTPNADGTATYNTGEGSVTVGTGANMPANWPSDAPANYSGATIVYSGTSNPQTGKSGSAVSYTVRASAAGVADYYKQQLTSAGWTIEATADMGGSTVISAKKDTRTIGIYIAAADDGNVSVTAGIEL